MKRAFTTSSVLIAAFLCSIVGCGSSGDLTRAETQRQFGVRMAKMNLWREAMFRFQRAVQIEPDNAMAHNNLAVAYEANGDFDAALKEYREALRLDRGNQYIQKNYSRFVEFTQRSKKREQRPAATSTATATAPTTTAGTTAAAPPPITDTATTITDATDAVTGTAGTTTTTTTTPPDGGVR